MWFLTIFVGFIASFYLGCWVLYRGVRKLVQRDSLIHSVVLLLLAAGLFLVCQSCFKTWYARIN